MWHWTYLLGFKNKQAFPINWQILIKLANWKKKQWFLSSVKYVCPQGHWTASACCPDTSVLVYFLSRWVLVIPIQPEPLSDHPFPETLLFLTPENFLQSYLFLRIWPKDSVSTEIRAGTGSNNTHHLIIYKCNSYMCAQHFCGSAGCFWNCAPELPLWCVPLWALWVTASLRANMVLTRLHLAEMSPLDSNYHFSMTWPIQFIAKAWI